MGAGDKKTLPYTTGELPVLQLTANQGPDTPGAPTRLGRYSLLEVLGAGGMGVVYGAYDPNLDRKVALKVLGAHLMATGTDKWQVRLLREARAMARLSHPNVVAVHDAGEFEGQVYVAMEFVDGMDLRRWLAKHRPWQEVLAVLAQAGQGLAAAHHAGLIHRDFKPENVLIGKNGRVCVTDFGLAALVQGGNLSGLTPAVPGKDAASGPHGPLLGTPEYLAPEQVSHDAADARADQFSFCVTLYEGLYGERPFEGNNAVVRAIAAMHGEVKPPPPGTKVPSHVRNVLLRGLAAKPEQRYPTMDALLDALQPRRSGGPRAIWAGLAVAAVAIAAAPSVYRTWQSSRCASVQTRLSGVWDPAVKDTVRASFLASGARGAEVIWARTQSALDDYAGDWARMRTDLCRAEATTEVDELHWRRVVCLERRAKELGALTRMLKTADQGLVDRATRAVDALEVLAACDDLDELAAGGSAKDAMTPEEGALHESIAQALTLRSAGRYDESMALAREVAAKAEAAGKGRLQAEALLVHCDTEGLLDRVQPEKSTCKDAALIATKAKADDLAALAWAERVTVLTHQGQHAEARQDLAIAEAMVRRLNGTSPEAEKRLANAHGFAAFGQGEYQAAIDAWQRVLKLLDRYPQVNIWDRASTTTNLGLSRMRLGQFEAAISDLQRGLELHIALLGEEHPEVGDLVTNLAMARMGKGETEPARALFEKAMAIKLKAIGPDANVALELGNLATIHQERGEYDEALALFERGQVIREKAMGANHPFIAASLLGRANALRGLRRYQEALPLVDRAVAIREKGYGPDHLLTGDAYRTRAMLALELGDKRRALELANRALAVAEKKSSIESPSVQYARVILGDILLAHGKPQQARASYEAVLANVPADKLRPLTEGRARFGLARALDALRDRAGALEQARVADLLLARVATDQLAERVALRQWLAARSRPQRP